MREKVRESEKDLVGEIENVNNSITLIVLYD